MTDESAVLHVYDSTLAIRVHDAYQVYALDSNRRQKGVQIGHGLRYSDLHPEAKPADVYESPDGVWTVRSVTDVLPPECVPVNDTFHRYLTRLQPWEADILQHVQLFLDPAYICYDLQRYFYAGSDGSVRFGTHGAFGWILANTEGERVASSMGPARCAKMDSYRAECTGMLSILRFLIRIAMYTNMEDPWRGLIGTDTSQSMLDSLFEPGEPHTRRQLATLDALDAEWDLLVEIQEALRELPGVDLVYVKAHQDDRVAYDCLPLMAQLNVDADRLAGKYNREHGAHRPFAFMAPTTGALLMTDEGTQTSHFSKELRDRSTGPSLEEYIRTKNQWGYCTFEAVNWAAHGKAVKARKPKRVHLTKYLHEALPTYHQANLMDGGIRKCIACGTADETIDHILRCMAPSREQWKDQWWQKLEHFHVEHRTHPLLRHVFREAITQWFHPDSPDVVSTVLFPQEVRGLILNQNAIGWRQIFRGRFANEWQRIQNEYYMKHKRKTEFKRTGERWQQLLIQVIWDAWFELWTLRNGEIHGTTAATRSQAQRREVDRQLTELYAARPFMESPVQALLEVNQEAQMQRPLRVTENWLAMAGPVIRKNVRKVRKVSLQGVRSLRAYFPRTGDG